MEQLDTEFIDLVWDHYRDHGRHDLPWRLDTRPYYILLSEVMLQQTQVNRVVVKFADFMTRFPTLESLALASTADVLSAWQGLGYNRRGLWLKQSAEQILRDYDGVVPDDPAELIKLPGIGTNTAGSIAAFAFNKPIVFIETNIRRVYIHHYFPFFTSSPSKFKGSLRSDLSTVVEMTKEISVHDSVILLFIESTLDRANPREWYWALMDYGSTLSKTTINPNRRSQHYSKQSKFEGSSRQLRGEVLRIFLSGGFFSGEKISELFADQRLPIVLESMLKDGLIQLTAQGYSVASA